MTNSVTKSFLSTTIGIAIDQHLIESVNDTVAKYMAPIELYESREAQPLGQQTQLLTPFNTEHNKTITWDNMLRQTSDWEGTLWGIPDWADRPERRAQDAVIRETIKNLSTSNEQRLP